VPYEEDPFFEPAPSARSDDPEPPIIEDGSPFVSPPSSSERPARPARPAATEEDPFAISADGTLKVRGWTDDTGTFRTRGRLIAVLGERVRILKDTGRTTTVPIERLSAADRNYVEQLLARYGSELASKLAAR
jgi:hypothetical protein